MKRVRVEMWQSADGQRFEDRKQCMLHELHQRLNKTFDDIQIPSNNLDIDIVIDVMVENAEEFNNAFNVYHSMSVDYSTRDGDL